MSKSRRNVPPNYAEAQLALEEAYHRLQYGDGEEAVQILLSVMPPLIAWGYLDLARQHLLQILNINADPVSKAKALTHLGRIMDIQSNYPKAMQYFTEALELYRSAQDPAGTAELLFHIGHLYNGRLNFSQASDYFQQCIQICQEQGITNGWAGSLLGLGWGLQHQIPEGTEALDLYHQSLTRAEAAGDFETLSSVCRQMAYLLWTRRQQQDEARRYIEKAIQISQQHNLIQEIAANCSAASNLYDQWGDHAAARVSCERAIQLFKALGDSYGLGNAYANLGKVCESRGDFEAAIHWYEKSRAIAMEIENRGSQVYVAVRLGIVLREMGRFSQARQFLLEAVRLAEQNHLDAALTSARNELAQLKD